MEFLRFGSSIPGSYWGCCACCIIQNFKVDPDAKASIQMVNGDGGQACGDIFAGPTWKDIFLQRIRVGTFDTRDMPNHAFFAILTDWQIKSGVGAKWLAILKENGFEFIRTVSNSVYDGQLLAGGPATDKSGNGGHPNYIFGLIRNIGTGSVPDPFTPPAEWTALPSVTPEAWEQLTDTKALTEGQFASQRAIWDKIGPAKFMTRKQLEDAGVPVWLGGQRSTNPQELATTREARDKAAAPKANAFVPKQETAIPAATTTAA